MEYLYLEENEIYEMQCGELFLTSKGRLIFHCTLCEKKFDGFDLYERHIKEHMPLLLEDDQMNTANSTNSNAVECFETDDDEGDHCYEYLESNITEFDSNDSNEVENTCSMTSSENGILNYDMPPEDELVLVTDIEERELVLKAENQVANDESYYESFVFSGKHINISRVETPDMVKNVETLLPKQSLQTAIKKEEKTRTLKRFSQQLQNEIAEYKKKFEGNNFNQNARNSPTKDIEIPKIVRAVKSISSQRSLLTPDEERKHRCPVCDAAFKDKHNMIHHLKRHSDNKDHKCPECDKRFFTTSEVNVHLKSHKKDERPFLCNICGKSFPYKNQFRTHFKRHTNQRNHKCELCGKAFFDGYLLKNHMAGHSSERPYECTEQGCTANFARRSALMNHKKLHQNKREYKCTLCDLRFNQKAGVISHLKTAHKSYNARHLLES